MFYRKYSKISAQHPNILYKGRWLRHQAEAIGAFPGVSLSIRFSGSSLYGYFEQINSETPSQAIYIVILVNGALYKKYNVSKPKRYNLYSRPKNIKEPVDIEIFKCSESYMGELRVLGFEGDDAFENVPPIQKSFLVIGDSFSAAMGNLGRFDANSTEFSGVKNSNEDNYFSYCGYLSRMLEAHYECIAYSGRGLCRNYLGKTDDQLPELLNRIRPIDVSTKVAWQKDLPNLVLIGLGVNDFHHTLAEPMNQQYFLDSYRKLLGKIFEANPNARVIVFSSPLLRVFISNGWDSYRHCEDCLKELDVIGKAFGAVDYFDFYESPDIYGEIWHPHKSTHENFANALFKLVGPEN